MIYVRSYMHVLAKFQPEMPITFRLQPYKVASSNRKLICIASTQKQITDGYKNSCNLQTQ